MTDPEFNVVDALVAQYEAACDDARRLRDCAGALLVKFKDRGLGRFMPDELPIINALAEALRVQPVARDTVPCDTASADLDWRKAWKLAAPVVVAARRFTLAEAEGNAALIEDSHFQLLRALTDYFDGGPPGESPIESVRRHLGR